VLAGAACVLLAAGLRVALAVQHPLIEPDVPAYVRDAARQSERGWRHGLDSYYPPLLPALMAAVSDRAEVDLETAGRIVSLSAGLLAVALTGWLSTALLGARAGVAAALLAAVHVHLVRASVAVLPEMLFGAIVAAWALLVLVPGGPLRVVAGTLVAAIAGFARVEGIALVPLTVVAAGAGARPGARARRVALAVTTALAIVGPWMLLVRAATGEWAVSGKEIAIVARRWDIEDASLLEVILRHPGAVLGDYPTHLRRQLGYAASVLLVPLVPLLAIGLGVPLAASARRARRVAVLTVVVFILAVAMINPGKRYVTPLLPLVLPWIAAGALALGDRLRGAGPAAAAWTRGAAIAGIAALAVHAAVPTARRWEDCFPRVCEWLETRYGRPLPPVMARDGRIAYLCDAPYVHEPRRRSITEIAPDVAESGAAAWLVKARRLPSTTLTGVRRVATLCEGRTALAVYEPHLTSR
jgi:hypothetical protein